MTQKLFTKNFILLILGQLTSLFGNFILKLALSMYVLEVTGSAAIFAGILSVATIPTIILSPLGGILADRADRRNIIVALDALTGISVLCATLLLAERNDLVVISVLLIILFIYMFLPKDKSELSNVTETTDTSSKYVAGVYSSSIVFHDQALEIEVLVDENHINSVRLTNLSETVTTMYPLIQPTLEDLAAQLIQSQSLDALTYSEENQYTSQVLIEALRLTLNKAVIKQEKTNLE